MARQTATSCQEKIEKRVSARLSALTQQIEAVLASHLDRVNLPGSFVAKL